MENILSQARFLKPDNWHFDTFTRENRTIRFGYAVPDKAQSIILCLPGLGEYCEKFYETARYFLEKDIAIIVIDWFGQGKSGRYLDNPFKRHGDDFIEDAADLHTLVTEYLPKHVPDLPINILAHSMGANIGMRYLQNFDHSIKSAAFCAPFFGIKDIAHMPDWMTLQLSSFLNIVNGKGFTSGNGEYSGQQRQSYDNNNLSTDPERFQLHHAWWDIDPELKIGDVTYGWVYHAIRSCIALRKNAASVQIPCIFAFAGQEKIVDNDAGKTVANLVLNAEVVTYPDAKHELLMEQDQTRDGLLNQITKMIEKHTS